MDASYECVNKVDKFVILMRQLDLEQPILQAHANVFSQPARQISFFMINDYEVTLTPES